MEEVRYRQLANFMRQRAQRIPGIPFLTLWQFAAAIGGGFLARTLGLPALGVLLIVILGVILAYVLNGEFVGGRLLAIVTIYLLIVSGRPRQVQFQGWDDLPDRMGEEESFATIAMHGSILSGDNDLFT